MLTVLQRKRLSRLREAFAYDVALGRQQGQEERSDEEELATLSLFNLSQEVASILSGDEQYRPSPAERAEAIACVVKTAFLGISRILQEDPEIAFQTGVVIQAELEKTLRVASGKTD